MEPIRIFINMPLDCKKTSFSSIKVHVILDRIAIYCMTSYTSKEVVAPAPQPSGSNIPDELLVFFILPDLGVPPIGFDLNINYWMIFLMSAMTYCVH